MNEFWIFYNVFLIISVQFTKPKQKRIKERV